MRLTRGCRAGGGVACSSLEYGGIRAATRRTPAPHDRLLLPTSLPPPPRSLLFVHLSVFPPSPSRVPTTIFPQEHRRGPATPSCYFFVSSVDSMPTTATTTMLPFLFEGTASSRCSSSKAIGKTDRRKKGKSRK